MPREKIKSKTVSISPEVHDRIAEIAQRDRRTISATVDLILMSVLNNMRAPAVVPVPASGSRQMDIERDYPTTKEECEPSH